MARGSTRAHQPGAGSVPLPQSRGLVGFLRSDLEHDAPDALSLVAELDGEVVGSLEARLLAPIDPRASRFWRTWVDSACTWITSESTRPSGGEK